MMNPRRDHRSGRAALFDGIEEGGIKASSSYSNEIDEFDNNRALDGLQDRVSVLKRCSFTVFLLFDSCRPDYILVYDWASHPEVIGGPRVSLTSGSIPNAMAFTAVGLYVLADSAQLLESSGLLTSDIHEEVDSHNRMLDRMAESRNREMTWIHQEAFYLAPWVGSSR
ncbi:Bet1-like SNARE 1-1-like protein [Drosera capensis]